jgi:uncharacterized repeat protein (TIGR01451 family)
VSRTLSAIGLALAVASGLAFFPSAAEAQKGLVYCPVSIDATGCGPIVTALTTDPSPFPDGVETAYDGSSGTVDLATADLSAYAVLVVPSLADGAGAEPYGLLRDQQIVGRLSSAFNGRNAVWSGTPDHGSTNREAKDALLRNLAGWARGDAVAGRGPGIVVLQDNSDDAAARYSWLRGISGLSVVADTTFDVYSNVQVLTSTGRQLLTNSSGLQIGYTNMAAYGLIASGTGASNDATGGRTARVVLVTTAGEASGPSLATVTTDKEDYQPGDTITVTGAGWESGETVSLLFHEDVDPPIHPDKTLTAVADADGQILSHGYEVEESDLGVRFTLTATGETSGRTAQTTFTDAPKVGTVTIGSQSPSPVLAGNNATYAITVFRGTGNGAFTVDLSATGLPNGATASFSPNPVSFGSSDNQKSATLTVSTTGATPAGPTSFTVRGETSGTDFATSLPASLSVTPSPDLRITKTHSGDFAQGDLGKTYTITVTNSGTVGTNGQVTVTDVQPTGLTFVGATGSGWAWSEASSRRTSAGRAQCRRAP